MAILEVKGLFLSFGGLKVLKDVNLSLSHSDKVYAIIGPNGAGKSSLFNAVTGLTPYEGRILFEGKALEGVSDVQRARLGLQRTFQNIRLFERLTVEENLLAALSRELPSSLFFLWGKARARALAPYAELIQEALEAFQISETRFRYPSELPYGVRRKVEIVRALMLKPRLLLLDEPAAGLNPSEKQEFVEMLKKTQASGVTLVMIEHNMAFISALANQVFVLHQGGVLFQGPVSEIKTSPLVQKAYLGEEVS